MRIINLNPDTDIGASAWYVNLEGHGLLMDSGMHPKREGREGVPTFKHIRNEDVDAIALGAKFFEGARAHAAVELSHHRARAAQFRECHDPAAR
jgi:predicted metal-dependent RNase